MSNLFEPFRLGRVHLKSRVVMNPMTRSRAPGNVPNALMAEYYGQRAGGGLIITEGTSPSPDGLGYARIPGLYTEEQARAWRPVTDAVHARGGHIFVQLMHTGRVGHPLNLPDGGRIVAPSAIAAPGTMWTDQEQLQPHPVPVEMTAADVEKALEELVSASALAVDVAGFDGVEIHGANGYLVEQFLNAGSNQRTDAWGGSPEKRIRFAVEAARRIAGRIGADRVGIRLSPFGANGGMTSDETTHETFALLAGALGALDLAYVHVVDHSAMGAPPVPQETKDAIRANFGGTVLLAGGYDRARAEADLDAGRGDLIGFGRPFLANPDLISRMQEDAPLNPPDYATLYTPGPQGYTDYPTLA